MNKNIIKRVNTILSILFFPLIIAVILLKKFVTFDVRFIVFFFILFICTIGFLDVLALDIDFRKKRILTIYESIFSIFIMFSFLGLSLFDIGNIFLIVLFPILLFISSGIIGLITNTILLGRGGPYVYETTSFWGKLANYASIVIGLGLGIGFVILYYSVN